MKILSSLCLFLCQLAATAALTKFMAIGDWGNDPGQIAQIEVADQMAVWAEENGCDFIVSTGDNFYPYGVTSNNSERFDSSWRDIYNQPSIADLPWYITVGNHDHDTEEGVPKDFREIYQVEFSAYEPRWKFPWLWHSFEVAAGDATILFVAIASECFREVQYDNDEQVAWLEEQLAASTADWIFVVGHHPAASSGWYWGDNYMLNLVVPLLEQYNVDFLLTGHDHNLQHITKTEENYEGTDYVISGGGGRGVYPYGPINNEIMTGNGYQLEHFAEVYGFVAFEVDEVNARFTFHDSQGNFVYEYTRSKA